MTERKNVTFDSQGVTCRAWHYPAAADAFTSNAGCACVVLAHGLGGTREAGLAPYAEAFAQAGLHALVFDYRHFGASDGQPRQLLSVSRQLDDWAAAIQCARGLDGVDPERIALWGSSFSGGHVIVAAARDRRIAAVSSQGPMMDGFSALTNIVRYAGMGRVLRMTGAGLRDLGQSATGQEPHYIPLVAEPGAFAAMSSHDALSGYTRITPNNWRNEFTARTGLTLGLYRPIKSIKHLPCPALILVCEQDSVAPAETAIKAGHLAGSRAEVHRYDMGHFDIYVGEGFESSSNDQIAFFRKHLRPEPSERPHTPATMTQAEENAHEPVQGRDTSTNPTDELAARLKALEGELHTQGLTHLKFNQQQAKPEQMSFSGANGRLYVQPVAGCFDISLSGQSLTTEMTPFMRELCGRDCNDYKQKNTKKGQFRQPYWRVRDFSLVRSAVERYAETKG